MESVHVVAAGAPVARGFTGFVPGIGARVSGDLTVTPGQTLYVNVGGTPVKTGCTVSDVACTGGFNGGGSSRFGGGGGGASDVRTITRDQSGSLGSRLIVAAGGGGSGSGIACPLSPFPIVLGGAGGNAGSDGGDARPCYDFYEWGSGGAGGQSVGGSGGDPDAESGSLGFGGDGGSFPGGGGGGWTLELIDHQLRQVVPGSGGGGADSFDGGAGTDNATYFDAGQGDASKSIP